MTTSPATRIGREAINGVTYYYEIRGHGAPLLVLHGGLGSIEMMSPVTEPFAKTRTVIAVDLHGHGRSTLGDRPIRLPEIADDLAVLLDRIDVGQVDVLGYSFGAGVAFRLGVQHPARVRRLALVSMCMARDGYYPELLPMQAQVGAAMAPMMKATPMYQLYAAVAPDLDAFPTLLDRMGDAMRQPYDWRDDVKRLTMPVLLVAGDSDMFRLEHLVEFYTLLGGNQRDAGWQREHMAQNRLAVLPGVTHYEMVDSPALLPTVQPFLDGAS